MWGVVAVNFLAWILMKCSVAGTDFLVGVLVGVWCWYLDFVTCMCLVLWV